MNKKVWQRYLIYILIGLGFSALPILQESGIIGRGTVTIWAQIIFYAVVAIGLNVLLGYSGLVSLGTAGFMGLGAYISGFVVEELSLPFLVGIVISIIVPTVAGVLVGLVSLRVSGMYLAIATLAVAEVLRIVFVQFSEFTGGFQGRRTDFPVIFGQALSREATFTFLVIVLVILLILTDNFIHSPVGRALLTMRASEPAAQAMGINLLKYKLMAFAIATAYAAIGGVLYAHFINFTTPQVWNLLLSLQILAVIVIGGMKTITGPIIGSIIVFGVPQLVLVNLPVIGDINGLAFIFNGLLIIVVIMFYPSGLVHIVHDIKKLWKKKAVTTHE